MVQKTTEVEAISAIMLRTQGWEHVGFGVWGSRFLLPAPAKSSCCKSGHAAVNHGHFAFSVKHESITKDIKGILPSRNYSDQGPAAHTETEINRLIGAI